MYNVELSQRAYEFINKLDNTIKEGITNGLKKLQKNPIPADSKFITRHEGEKIFRIRIGDYRALYKIKENPILVTKTDKRPRVYSQ